MSDRGQAGSRPRPLQDQTRRAILDAAYDVYARRGIAASSLTEVAAAAGVTRAVVHATFPSKDELVLTLMEEHAAERIAASLAAVSLAEGPAGTLTEVGAALTEALHADGAWHRLLAEYLALAHRDPERREGLRQRRGQIRDAVAAALTTAAERIPLTLPLPADDLAVVFLALSNGLAVEAEIDPAAVADDLLGRVLLRLVLGPGTEAGA